MNIYVSEVSSTEFVTLISRIYKWCTEVSSIEFVTRLSRIYRLFAEVSNVEVVSRVTRMNIHASEVSSRSTKNLLTTCLKKPRSRCLPSYDLQLLSLEHKCGLLHCWGGDGVGWNGGGGKILIA